MTAAITAGANQSASHRADRNRPEQQMSLATMMVHVDVEHDCEQRVQLALGLAMAIADWANGYSAASRMRCWRRARCAACYPIDALLLATVAAAVV
jgi:hypothetical protein